MQASFTCIRAVITRYICLKLRYTSLLDSTMRLKLWGYSMRHLKCELVAAFADVEVEVPPFTPNITNKTPWYLAMNRLGKVCWCPKKIQQSLLTCRKYM